MLLLLVALLTLGPSSAQASEPGQGARVFSANCAACHMGGGNVVHARRTLKQEALARYVENYSSDHRAAIAERIRNGHNAMPAFAGRLSEPEIQAAASYVDRMALQGWGRWPRPEEGSRHA
ncbi:c-type cytochrome [Synechococcus sp. RSCCF101]|uniref:c-type cytochrome n=1 Tax=Synechococcus sp. RSCCF101 TaxID=2511069 RepID=UPI001CD9A65A|nr:c-type cytochrome [Synechococcus sp. RSCCF101]